MKISPATIKNIDALIEDRSVSICFPTINDKPRREPENVHKLDPDGWVRRIALIQKRE